METCDVGGNHDCPCSGSTRRSTSSRDIDGVGALALGDRQRDGGRNDVAADSPRRTATYCDRLLAAVGDVGDVAQEHRLAVGHADHHVADVVGAAQELAGLEQELAIAGWRTCPTAGGGWMPPARLQHLQGRHRDTPPAGLRRASTAHLAALPADDGDRRDVRHLLDRVVELRGEPAQLEIAVAVAPERQRQDRHVVDRARLDERRRGAGRDQVEVGEHLLVQPDDALLFVLADVESARWPSTCPGWRSSRCTRRPGSPRAASPSAW